MSKIYYLLIVLAAIIALTIFNVYRTKHFIRIGEEIANNAKPFNQKPENPTEKFLIYGDSSAVGTGSLDPQKSVAGYLAKDYPKATIINKGINGLKANELIKMLKNEEEKADTFIIQIGGNDIVRFTNLTELQKDLEKIIDLAKTRSNKVIIFHGGNVGTSKLFPYGLRWIYTNRTKKVQNIYLEISAQKEIQYVDMFRKKKNDKFYLNPKKYYAADYFHPSADGYKLWYEDFKKQI
jgi:lysophospholipase L1-like esterase